MIRAALFDARRLAQLAALPLLRAWSWPSATFEEQARLLDESQWWPAQQLRLYQDELLAALVRHAYEHVPYYREVFDARRLRPADVTRVADLAKLPLLTKDDLRTRAADLRARNVPEADVVWKSTSGTTGAPVRVAIERRHLHASGDAFHSRQFEWAGCSRSDVRASLLATTLPPTLGGHRRLSAYSPHRRVLTLSSYDLRPDTVGAYAAAFRRYQPVFLQAFPSAAERLALLLDEARIPCPVRLRAVFTQSETLYPWQRALLQRYFGCPVFDWYAMEERAVCACECEQHDGHHVVSEFGVVELLRPPEARAGDPAEIVATPLHHYAMPLLRYRTGDMATPVDQPCPCGRGLPRMRLVGGRSRNFAVLGDGHLAPVTVVDIPKASARVAEFQFVQEVPGTITLMVVPRQGFGEADVRAIRENLREKFGEYLQVDIEVVSDLPRTGRGKRPLLVQRLDVNHAGATAGPSPAVPENA